MEAKEAKFKRYLLREFLWELSQHDPLPSNFVSVDQEFVEVLNFRGYDNLRIRFEDIVYDIHLSWRKDLPPDIQQVDPPAT